MIKKKALGMDPLTWLKSKNKEDKLNKVASKQRIPEKKPSGSVVNLSSPKQKTREMKTEESRDSTWKFKNIILGGRKSARKPKPSAKAKNIVGGMLFNDVSSEEKLIKPFEPKVVYPSNTEQKTRDVKTYEPSDVTEKLRGEILGKKKSSRIATAKENPATIFVVVYTILLLVLGFLVYKDLTGKITKLEAQLTSIERQTGINPMTYRNAKFDELR
ncbi:MAG: hypothetical protein JYX80_12135 [Candidatus Scalindua sediminis]|nr:hypothetical protein [Candidatus Scalindua sediminis]HDY67050.1 hypothetical protein [Candidatus Scalindua sp.]